MLSVPGAVRAGLSLRSFLLEDPAVDFLNTRVSMQERQVKGVWGCLSHCIISSPLIISCESHL